MKSNLLTSDLSNSRYHRHHRHEGRALPFSYFTFFSSFVSLAISRRRNEYDYSRKEFKSSIALTEEAKHRRVFLSSSSLSLSLFSFLWEIDGNKNENQLIDGNYVRSETDDLNYIIICREALVHFILMQTWNLHRKYHDNWIDFFRS